MLGGAPPCGPEGPTVEDLPGVQQLAEDVRGGGRQLVDVVQQADGRLPRRRPWGTVEGLACPRGGEWLPPLSSGWEGGGPVTRLLEVL